MLQIALPAIRPSLCVLAAWTGMLSAEAIGASADIANISPSTQNATAAKPNLMFILDDSGSMTWDFLPDTAHVYKFESADDKIDNLSLRPRNQTSLCAGAASRNRAAYNPDTTYLPPVTSAGAPFSNATFADAWKNGFDTPAGKVNLSNLAVIGSDNAGRRLIPPETWLTGSSSNGSNYGFFYYATPASSSVTCNRNSGSYNPSTFTIVRTTAAIRAPGVAAGSAAALTNYANWFSYYRTRILTMRSAAGKAFSGIDPAQFRVGFMTINERIKVTDSPVFLHSREFNLGTQKTDFYSRLYGVPVEGNTPLRLALSTAGAYFAKKVPNQTDDPVQYSCQRNYAILTSDGYWNVDGGQKLTSTGALTAMGNEDGPSSGEARPYLDDARSSGTGTGGGGVSDTLSDAAFFYYKTPLRTAAMGNCIGGLKQDGTTEDVCGNNVAAITDDPITHQHMNTFTLGLGLAGELTYDPDYARKQSGSYHDIKTGTRAWPRPVADTPAAVDDLWHAAVNGRGYFYSASDPEELARSLIDALTSITSQNGAGAGAGTSSLRPVQGESKVFIAKFVSSNWSGELEAYDLDPRTGGTSTLSWKAGEQLRARNLTNSPRTIFMFDAAAPNKRRNFAYANLTPAEKAYFDGLCNSPQKLGQCASLSAPGNESALAKLTGANVVSYLAGSRQYELAADLKEDQVFRTRTAGPLGDFGNASPVYVKKPPFRYVDGGYAAFANDKADRMPMVYAAANDGMLHAFKAETGEELWAYVPSMVLPQMYRLADQNYVQGANHRYFVDGTPTIADVYDKVTAAWRTVLIGGLGAGGKGYYALDITDPANPKGLWEFTDTHLGLTFGNPVVTKLKSGDWVVVFSSGYNNNTGGGDGNGRLYVRNVLTGTQAVPPLSTFSTGTTTAGNTATPNNLGRLNAWVDDPTNNTAKRLYAGDMLGNLWRFDIDNNLGPAGNEAQLMGTALSSSSNAAQPITAQPQLSEIIVNGAKLALVSFGTGRLTGLSDLSNADVQSIYVVKDELLSTSAGTLRGNPTMVQQTLSGNRLDSPLPIDWSSKLGWFVDFSINSKERVTVDPDQQGNSLTVVTTIPSLQPCTSGVSRLYSFDVASAKTSRSVLYDRLVVGLSNVLLLDNKNQNTVPASLLTKNDGSLVVEKELGSTPNPPLVPRRSSWRELIN